MADLSVRSSEDEMMDDLSCSGEIVDITLRELETINKWLGGNAVTVDALAKLLEQWPRDQTLCIADLGCGGGDMLRVVNALTTRMGIQTRLTGIDANPGIIRYARRNLNDLANAELLHLNIFSDEFRRLRFDIVIGTLFFHHFSNESLIRFFSDLRPMVRFGMVINDIHRHFLAYYSIKFLTWAFSRSAMVRHDAPLSVARAFSKKDLVDILGKAGITRYAIRWKWAFRWQAVIRTDS